MSTGSQLNTVTLPPIGSNNPATLAYATDKPFRVVVRNVGAVPVVLAHDAGTLENAPAVANTFLLPTGASEVFVLAPKQGIFAAGVGGGGMISIAISEAISGSFGA
jgi:hypothetical protein